MASVLSLTRPLTIILPLPPILFLSRCFFFCFCLFPEVFQHGVWKEVGSLKHPDLISLADRMKSTVLMSRASGTVNGYTRAFNWWKEFASRRGEVATFPAEPLPVALYLQHLLESTSSCSSVDVAFYRLKWVHETAGLVSPTDSSLVAAVREASKRILGTGRSNRREPMPRDLLQSIVDRTDLSNGLELRNVCLYVLCFAGFLRFDDVSRVKRNEISFHSGYMSIKVEKSKNDQLRQGDEVLISEGEGATCPVKILKEYLNMFCIDPMSNEFIFRQLIKTKKSYKLVCNNKPISYSTFRDHLRKSLRGFVSDPQVYGTHSFRSGGGGASAAANSGVPDRVFQRHGRWKSASAQDGYVKDSTDVKLSVSRSLGL